MFCPQCGKELPAGAQFCGKCGAQLSSRFEGAKVKTVEDVAPASTKMAHPTVETPFEISTKTATVKPTTRSDVSVASQPASSVVSQWFSAPAYPQTDKPLNFYKFVVWFLCYASAAISVYNALRLFASVSQLSSYHSMIQGLGYGADSGLGAVMFFLVVLAIGMILLAVWFLVVRGRLARFEKNAIKSYLRVPFISIWITGIIAVLAVFGLGSTTSGLDSYGGFGSYLGGALFNRFGSSVAQLVMTFIAVCVSWYLQKLYFERRSELFVNEAALK
ncbi:MAG: zinc ribbon domain-containing protein [Atopobiaceae bacterium]|nr:zinc ribbon domain-containing protein [Atopobiaceae bacterium]